MKWVLFLLLVVIQGCSCHPSDAPKSFVENDSGDVMVSSDEIPLPRMLVTDSQCQSDGCSVQVNMQQEFPVVGMSVLHGTVVLFGAEEYLLISGLSQPALQFIRIEYHLAGQEGLSNELITGSYADQFSTTGHYWRVGEEFLSAECHPTEIQCLYTAPEHLLFHLLDIECEREICNTQVQFNQPVVFTSIIVHTEGITLYLNDGSSIFIHGEASGSQVMISSLVVDEDLPIEFIRVNLENQMHGWVGGLLSAEFDCSIPNTPCVYGDIRDLRR